MEDFDSLVDDSQSKSGPTSPNQTPDQSKPLMFDQLKDESSPKFDDLKDDTEKYSSTGQQALAAVEGLGQGIAGPLATGFETKILGVPSADIVGRQQANPITHGAGQAVGNVGVMLAAPELKIAQLGKIGSAAINGMIQMGVIQGGDEISKALLGKGDPLPAVAANIAESGAMGLLGGGLFGAVEKGTSKGLSVLENSKLGNKLTSFLAGFGHAAKYPNPIIATPETVISGFESLHQPSFELGKKAYGVLPGKIGRGAIDWLTAHATGDFGGYLSDKIIKSTGLEGTINKNVSKATGKYVGPALLKASTYGEPLNNIGGIVDHATALGRGAQKIERGVDAVFKSSGKQVLDFYHSEKDKEKLKDFIENGGVEEQIRNQANEQGSAQSYASGGEISQTDQTNPIANHFPEQNVLLNAAKGRVSGYLNSIRPIKNTRKLPFDSDAKDPNKEKDYDKALGLAINPLGILKDVSKGTLLPKHMSAFTKMYPELYSHLSKKLTERMAQGQINGDKKPPYKVRQALSLFLGSSLDSTLTPTGIQSAQSVFMRQRDQRNQASISKTSLNKMGQNSMTPEQGRMQRLNKS